MTILEQKSNAALFGSSHSVDGVDGVDEVDEVDGVDGVDNLAVFTYSTNFPSFYRCAVPDHTCTHIIGV
jgi:hypothetical protein